MVWTHLNSPLAKMFESRLIYALDTEARDKTGIHCQPGIELNLTCRGRGTLHVGSESFPLNSGTLVIIPEPLVHHLETHTPGRYARSVVCVAPGDGDTGMFEQTFKAMLNKPPFLTSQCLHLDADTARQVQNLISRITEETRQHSSYWMEMACALTYELLTLTARLTAQPNLTRPPSQRLADEVAAYVTSFIDGDLATHTVAAHFGICREHLSRVFHKQFGITYQRYVMNQRIEAARRLLTNAATSTSLLEIALAAGFQSHAHFSRIFRKHHGVTPAEFRKQRHIGN